MVEHRRGSLHQVPDALSRIPEQMELGSLDFDPDLFQNSGDAWFRKRYEQLEKFPDKWPEGRIENCRLFHLRFNQLGEVIQGELQKWKLVIPAELGHQFLQACHDVPTSGHLGISKMYFRTSQDCYWPEQFRDVVKYARSCEICQRQKVE